MVVPKKRFGQHFLTDEHIAEKISNLLLPDVKNVIEIGPGKGILTKYILTKNLYNLKAIEIDVESLDYLHHNFADCAEVFVHGDFLKTDLSTIFPKGEKFQIIGNFPYNISSQILFKALEYKDIVAGISGMFQKEVAQRIISVPGNKVYGILSVLMQTWYNGRYMFTVNEGSFLPPPKVKSGVITLLRNDITDIGVDEQAFTGLVKTAFNQRRKTLRNSLRQYHLPDAPIMDARPETLTWQDFASLAKNIAQHSP